MTPAGIEPATFRLVAQHLNHCAIAGPPPFLGAFAKLLKAAISFVVSVRPHGTTRLPPDGFS
jgi:hypothetical protein